MRSREVHLWRGSLVVPHTRLAELRARLTPDEIARAERFHFEAHGHRFIAGRGYLREILAAYLHAAPEEIRFQTGAFGKPVLVDARGWHFNVAHSDEELLIALARSPVGVDVEGRREIPELETLARMVFSDLELDCWEGIPEPNRAEMFLALWTRKEALLKGMGLGISEHLKNVSVYFESAAEILIPRNLSSERWAVCTVPEASAVWSLALPCASPEVKMFELS